MSKGTVAIGMSGGTDSTVAAYLLQQQGYNVIGFTLKLWDDSSRCCSKMDLYDARVIAKKFGFPHYTVELNKLFKKEVIDYFINEYINGRTPNPCVVCNKQIKFDFVFTDNLPFSYDFIATGHYAKIKKIENNLFFAQAKDLKKSQEYFLARVNKKYLDRILFPLSDYTKDEVREILKSLNINLNKKESQELCFINNNEKHYEFILKNMTKGDFSGDIINKEGKVLGTHSCYFKYTIGQRQGLGISDSTPYYVIGIDSKNKNVIVGKKEDTFSNRLITDKLYWYKDNVPKEIKAKVKIRYNHRGAEAVIRLIDNGRAEVIFDEPQHAVTSGQLAVFYDNDIVIGSGWIV